jgi:hypothetical protein
MPRESLTEAGNRQSMQPPSLSSASPGPQLSIRSKGAGWLTFDPTNRCVGSFNLMPVAVVRDTTGDPSIRQFRSDD